MAKLFINTTPKSITVKDDNGNQFSVFKNDTGIQFTSTVIESKKNHIMLEIGGLIKKIVANPTSKKDGWDRRFNRIKRACEDVHTFITIKNRLQQPAEIAIAD